MNSTMKSATVLAAAALVFAGAQSTPESKGTLKIVSSLPRTGSANAQTNTLVNGIRLAIDEAGGQVDGWKIEYEDMDDASPQKGNWDPAVEAQNANSAVNEEKCIAYIGTFNSGAAKVAIPILNRAGLVMVSPANTYPGLTKPGKGEANEPMVYRPTGKINYFRVVPADDLQGVQAANWANDLGVKKVFILHDRELYGKGIADVFRKQAETLGMKVVGFEGIDTKASNYRSLATKVKATAPELVYFGGTTQSNAGQVAKDLRSGGFEGLYMVPDGCFEQAFIEAAGADNLNGKTYVTFGGLPPEKLTGKGAEFCVAYRNMFKADPEAYAAYGYEAARVILQAIDKVETKDRASVLAAVAATKDFDGVLGKWSFDANGDTSGQMFSGQTVKDGKFEFVKILGN